MTNDNDPLAGVPADLDAYIREPGKWPRLDVHSLVLDCKRLLERERQQRLKAEASLATAQRVNQIAVRESTAVADAVRACVAEAAVKKTAEMKSQLKQVEAERDALRARVERLRRIVQAAIPVYLLDEIEAKRWQHMYEAMDYLEPGDLEG